MWVQTIAELLDIPSRSSERCDPMNVLCILYIAGITENETINLQLTENLALKYLQTQIFY